MNRHVVGAQVARRTRARRAAALAAASAIALASAAALLPSSGQAEASASSPGRPRVNAASTTSLGSFSKTITATRTHLIAGADVVADSRTITVKVDETRNLRDRQPINVSWTGAHPTGGFANDPNSGTAASLEYPVVLLECRGVDSTSVTLAKRLRPETCWTQTPRERSVSSDINFPAFRLDRYAAPADRAQEVGVPPNPPAKCGVGGTEHWVPFVAVDGTAYYGGPGGCAGLAPEASEEEQRTPPNTTYAQTDLAGRGAARFIIDTADSNASLGCSSTVPCALVVIPVMGVSCDVAAAGLPASDRPPAVVQPIYQTICSGTGNYDPQDPHPIITDTEDATVAGRIWWTASNWRNRITVPLQFAPAANTCDLVNASKPTLIYGSQAMRQATLQWAPAFCTDPRLFKFQHVQTAEPQAKNLVNTGNVEAALAGAPPSTAFTRPIVQAPIAVSGFAIAFNIDDETGHPVAQLKLTPRLLAKLMTQSYASNPTLSGEYAGVKGNPLDLGNDPEYKALNPGAVNLGHDLEPASVLFSVSSDSDVLRSLTAYIDADPEARSWLDGAPDPWGMTVNPNYKGIVLPVDGWPLLDTFVSPFFQSQNFCLQANPTPWLDLVAAPVSDPSVVTLNIQYAIANSQVICQNPGASNQRLVSMGRQSPGRRFVVGVVSLADAARYQLNVASLQSFSNGTTRDFVPPTDASLRAAVHALEPVKDQGSWPIPYAALRTAANAGAYPGTMVMTVDVPTTGVPSADALRLAKFVRWAVSTGQVPGAANGQLPGGYLPMTAANGSGALLAYARSAADAIQAQQGYVPAVDGSSSPPPTPSPTTSQVPTTGQPASGPTSQPTSSGAGTVSATPSASPTGSPTSAPVLIAAAGSTSSIAVGPLGASIPALLGIAFLTGLAALATGLWGRV